MVPERDGWSGSAALTVLGPMTGFWLRVTGQFLVQLIFPLKKHLHLRPESSRCDPELHYYHNVGEN